MKVAEALDIAWWKIKSFYKWFTPSRFWAKWRVLFVLGLLVIIFHVNILQAIGGFLIKESKLPENVDAIFVLGGNTYDRSNYAAELYFDGFSEKVVTLGANVAQVLKSAGLEKQCDALVAETHLLRLGVPEEELTAVKVGTSTKEEANAILNYCKQNDYSEIVIISDKFHTRRVSFTFDHFEDHDIKVYYSGSSHSEYDEMFWWKNEPGMIMVNNEYVKLMYYYLKY